MSEFSKLGIKTPTILIPTDRTIMQKWAVVACDQYTSEPGYWKKVEKIVGDTPSTYHMILPEAYLGTAQEKQHRQKVALAMKNYLQANIFEEINSMVYIERSIGDHKRKGLLLCLDLEQYEFSRDSHSLIRATEGTIVDRLPPRIKIREKAPIEIPHILVLIDDPEQAVIEPLSVTVPTQSPLYDFDLMQNSGHITAYQVDHNLVHSQVVPALEVLAAPSIQKKKYEIKGNIHPLLFAVGDGNHSLATAKSVWENNKHDLPADHPARFALVEVVNLHDTTIEFEAIHRLVVNVTAKELGNKFLQQNSSLEISKVFDFESMAASINSKMDTKQRFGLFDRDEYNVILIQNPEHTITVGSVTRWLDMIQQNEANIKVDYIHGDDSIRSLGQKPEHAGIYLPAMPKRALFESVLKDGPLPRKTFSMGEAHEKRFYLECRKIL